jgi:hypothetical protein
MDDSVLNVAQVHNYSATNNEKITNPVNCLSHISSTAFHIWIDNIKTGLWGTIYEGVNWIYLARGSDKFKARLNFRVLKKMRSFFLAT